MTWQKIKDLIWTGLGTDSTEETDLVVNADLNNILNSWEVEMIKKVLLLPKERWETYLSDLVSSSSITGTGSTYHWSLPSDFFGGGDYIVTVNSVNAESVSPEYKRISDANSLYRPDALTPLYYLFNNDIWFITAPANGYAVVLYYIKNPTGTGGSSPEIAPSLHQSAVYFGLRECFNIDGDNVQVAEMNAKYLKECEGLIV